MIISIMNNKGGVGKTTITINLGVALGRRNKKILLVDMDPQCNTTNKMLLDEKTLSLSIYDILRVKAYAYKALNTTDYLTAYKNVFILPNIPESTGLESEIYLNMKNNQNIIFRLKDFLKGSYCDSYDYILIDCPPNLGIFAISSLLASDCVIIPIESGSIDSITSQLATLRLLNKISTEKNPDLKLFRILINKFQRNNVDKSILATAQKNFGDKLFKTVIPSNTHIKQAEAHYKSVLTFNTQSNGARAFRQLAKEFLKIIEDTK